MGKVTGGGGDFINITGGRLSATQVGTASGKLEVDITSGVFSASGATHFGTITLTLCYVF